MTAHERLTRFEQWRDSLPARQTTYEVTRELEQRARAINGGKQLPRPWSQANGGPY